MTSLHPGSTDPAPPGLPGPSGPSADGAGSSPPADVPRPPGAGAPLCSIATAADGGATGAPGTPGTPVRHDTVPQPRMPEDVEARLREAFAARLRAARAEGRSLAELAAACRRPVAEVRALLGEAEAASEAAIEAASESEADTGAGTDAGTGAGAGSAPDRAGPGFVRFQRTAAPAEGNRPAAVPRSGREELRILGSRRPSPSRRLRRMHPHTDPTGQEAAARETAATDPAGAGWAGTPAGAPTGVPGTVTDHPASAPPAPSVASAPGAHTVDRAGAGVRIGTGVGIEGWTAAGTGTEEFRAEPPLGILIGGSPVRSDAVGRPEERTPVRVAAEPIRVGRGTTLVVLPSWRPAIAVSVSTEQLITETGLTAEQLVGARLTVRMNPWALHDRELDLHGWELGPVGPGGRAARPGGRGQAFGM
ncbi:hypothetical protein ACIQWA_24455 [Kitasatospora sp. NPDC098652]|uniref:hypothetical protein n=1 Tax=Kitasatospora sp. NPDC098652 TaxID=3364095 RepID=UPI0038305A53